MDHSNAMPPNDIFSMRALDMPEDEELIKLHRRVSEQEDKLDTHVTEQYKVNSEHGRMHQDTMEAIAELTKATSGMVDVWSTAHSLQKFIKWLSGFAVIGAVMLWLAEKLDIL